jgi:outer membrane protein TolC
MTTTSGTRLRSFSRAASCALLTAALALAACQSPLRTGEVAFNADSYYQSLISREVAAHSGPNFGMSGTVIGPTTPLARIDSPGPQETAPAGTQSASQPSIAKASLIGLPSASLGMAEQVVNLSLQDALARAMAHSLAIKVEAYNPAIKEAQLIQAEAAFDATFFGRSQFAKADDPTISPGLGNGVSWLNQFGVRKILPTGAQVQATASVTYRDIDTSGLSPLSILGLDVPGRGNLANSYTTAVGIEIKQPLLRGFGAEVNQANIYLAQRDQRISLAEFKLQVTKNVAQVEEAYLGLILARVRVEVLQRLVVSSEQTYNLILQRRDLDATKASINQALSSLEESRAQLHAAQREMRVASDRLKVLINDPSLDLNGNSLIYPTDQPIQEPFSYNIADCVRTSLMQRPEMQQARLQIERADIVVRVARNGLLPKLDLTVGGQSNGLRDAVDAAFGEAFNPTSSLNFSALLEFEIPIGNRGPEAELRETETQRRQAVTNMVLISQQVVLDVRTQLREVLSAYDEIAIRDRVRQASALYFQGIIEIEDIRQRTPEFLNLKLDSQQRLAIAEQNLITSIVNYNLAILHLEQAKGTLLEFDQISLDRPPRANDDDGINYIRFMGKTRPKN